MTQGF